MIARVPSSPMLLFVACQLVLGGIVAYEDHPSLPSTVAFLTAWTPLPTVIAWAIATLLLRMPHLWLHRAGMLISGYFVAVLWCCGLLVRIVNGPASPDTAAHMAHFLWPLLLCIVQAGLYCVVLLAHKKADA